MDNARTDKENPFYYEEHKSRQQMEDELSSMIISLKEKKVELGNLVKNQEALSGSGVIGEINNIKYLVKKSSDFKVKLGLLPYDTPSEEIQKDYFYLKSEVDKLF